MEEIYPYKILIVEDEKAIRENYAIYLKMFFAEVFEAADGEKAYALYKSKKPDIMIVDINIPKISGLDLVQRIRENDYSTKVIMLTAHSDKSFLLKAVSLKLTKYLVKPVSRKAIIETLELAVNELTFFTFHSKKLLILNEEYKWDFKESMLLYNLHEIRLTPKEKKILNILFSNIDIIIPYEVFLNNVWDEHDQFTIDTLKTMMKNIRKKLPKDIIQNVYSVGYKTSKNSLNIV